MDPLEWKVGRLCVLAALSPTRAAGLFVDKHRHVPVPGFPGRVSGVELAWLPGVCAEHRLDYALVAVNGGRAKRWSSCVGWE